jgi:hypothetical protein
MNKMTLDEVNVKIDQLLAAQDDEYKRHQQVLSDILEKRQAATELRWILTRDINEPNLVARLTDTPPVFINPESTL